MSDRAPNRHPDPADDARPDPPTEVAAEEDLRSTEDSIRDDIRRLANVEDDKRALDAGDDRVERLSDEAVRLADRIASETRAERQLSDDIR